MTLVKRNQNQNWVPSIFNDLFNDDWIEHTHTTAPAVNVKESKNNYVIEVAAPGMTKEDFNLHVDEYNNLVISMEKKEEKNEEQKEHCFLRREFYYSTFQQSMILPDDVNKDKIEASVKHGILSITLPKLSETETVKPHHVIEIQ